MRHGFRTRRSPSAEAVQRLYTEEVHAMQMNGILFVSAQLKSELKKHGSCPASFGPLSVLQTGMPVMVSWTLPFRQPRRSAKEIAREAAKRHERKQVERVTFMDDALSLSRMMNGTPGMPRPN